jgi:hypothetical protein
MLWATLNCAVSGKAISGFQFALAPTGKAFELQHNRKTMAILIAQTSGLGKVKILSG